MATNVWQGYSQPVAQVDTFTLASVGTGRVYTITMNLKTVSYTATVSDTATTAAAALQALLAASSLPEFLSVTWTQDGAVITATATTPGRPFTATGSATGGASNTKASVTSSAGPNHFDDTDNWSLARLPAGELTTPVQAAAVAIAGGTLVDTTPYYWVITAYNALGETIKSNQQTLTIAAPNQTATLSWAAVVGADGYKVYRSTTTNVYTPTALVTTIVGGSTVTYNDTGTALSAGAVLSSSTALGDDVYIPSGAPSMLYGINQSYKVWNSLHVDAGFANDIGLPDINTNGYFEYLDTYLKASPKTIYFGEKEGAGSSLCRIDTSTNQAAWIITQTGATRTQGLPSLYVKGSHASSTMIIQQGDVGLAMEPGTTAQFATIKVGYESSPPTDVNLTLGSGVTVGTSITQLGGVIRTNCNIPALTTTSGSQGEFYLYGTATLTTLTMYGGSYFPLGTGTHTTVTLNSGATFDKSQNVQGMTITNTTLKDGCTFLDPSHSITFTNPIAISGNLAKMVTDFGSGYNLAFS